MPMNADGVESEEMQSRRRGVVCAWEFLGDARGLLRIVHLICRAGIAGGPSAYEDDP